MPPELTNPFSSHKADDTVTIPAGHVPELHADVLAACERSLARTRQSGQGVGMFVVGEAGSGKSQLIAQWRARLAGEPGAVLVAVRMSKAYAGRLWRHLRKRLFEELLRPYADAGHGADGLTRILRNRFPAWAAGSAASAGGLLGFLTGGPGRVDLRACLKDFGQGEAIDYALARVLPLLGDAETRDLARAWLAGGQLGEKDLQRLGLPPAFPTEQEQEVQAQEVVQSVLALAGDKTTLLVCFDEVEAIQAGTWDAEALRQFTTLTTDLLGQVGPRLVVTFIRPNVLMELRKAVEPSNVQKMAQEHASIPTLTWEQTARVAIARLEGEPTVRAARQAHADDPYWPLGRPFLDGLFKQYKRALTPRHLIQACKDEFDRVQRPGGKPDPGSAATPRNDATRPDAFLRCWEQQRRKNLEKIQSVAVDPALGLGIPWLVHLLDLPFETVQPGLDDVNLAYQPRARGRPVGVSFCNQTPQTLWRRLDRLAKQWAKARGQSLAALAVVRSAAERTTPAGEKRLDALRGLGCRVVLVDPQQLAELAAFQVMMTGTRTGSLVRSGRPIPSTEYEAWVREHLSQAVKELLEQILGPGALAPGPVPEPTRATAEARP